MNWKTLLWWLGPWCNQEKSPKSIKTDEQMVRLENHSFRFRIYSGPVRQGAVLVLPGLHPDGLNDHRVDRFCRVLARSGAIVGVPELPTMTQSVMVPKLLDDTEAAVELFASYLSDFGRCTFGVFCISASSIAGLHLATHPTWSSCLSRVHLFGGFADWMASLRFAMTGTIVDVSPQEQIEVDPLSLPVVYMNLMQTFPQFLLLNTTLQSEMFSCLHQYVSQSWEKPNVKHPADTRRIATDIYDCWKSTSNVQEVDWKSVHHIFFQACALESGGNEYVHAFLDAYCTAEKGSNADWLDVRTLLQKIQIPLDISHGRDDFVVPYPQAEQLAEWSASSSTRVFVTGLYHHTGVVSLSKLFRLLLGLPKEIWTSIQMVRALADLGESDSNVG